MSKSFIKTNFDLCTGCSLCQLACSDRLVGGYNPHKSVLRIKNTTENLYHTPVVCNQCVNAYCLNVCPAQAITVDENTHAKIIDHTKCVGCGTCARYCPIGVINVDREIKKSRKCDLCDGDPLCVKNCPTGALELISRTEAQAGGEGGCHV